MRRTFRHRTTVLGLVVALLAGIVGVLIPTTVASAAPELRPKRPMATATASSKKFDVPIRAQGAATLWGSFHAKAQA